MSSSLSPTNVAHFSRILPREIEKIFLKSNSLKTNCNIAAQKCKELTSKLKENTTIYATLLNEINTELQNICQIKTTSISNISYLSLLLTYIIYGKANVHTEISKTIQNYKKKNNPDKEIEIVRSVEALEIENSQYCQDLTVKLGKKPIILTTMELNYKEKENLRKYIQRSNQLKNNIYEELNQTNLT